MSLAAADALMGVFGFKRVPQIALTLPWPPSANHYWGQSGNRKYITKRGLAFREQVAESVAESGAHAGAGRLAVFVSLFQPTRRKCDIDNYMKALLDALQEAGLYENDEQIDRLEIVRMPPTKGGKCCVVVTQA